MPFVGPCRSDYSNSLSRPVLVLDRGHTTLFDCQLNGKTTAATNRSTFACLLSSCHSMSSCYHSLHVIATGNGFFTVRQAGSNYGNRVRLLFGAEGATTIVSCTCTFVVRFKTPCCDVIAVGRGARFRVRVHYLRCSHCSVA